MDARLSLKLNIDVIERAKKYALDKNISLSKLIENYLDSLTSEQNIGIEISPFIKSISTGKSISSDIDPKKIREDYTQYVDKKYH